ncbi:MAG: hypothetical protein QM627_00250 [Luteolibacter sp.]
MFEKLKLWMDPVARSGPEAMAVDEWSLGLEMGAFLRVYRWQGEWGSVGYFGKLREAEADFPGLRWVRRWTGGGTVDHRRDWTYSLVIPPGEAAFFLKGAESYRLIHEALAGALNEVGISASLSSGKGETGASACFENPVCHDLIDAQGAKVAGAGQRRTKSGLLHQGSVALKNSADSLGVAEAFAGRLARRWEGVELEPKEAEIAVFRERYEREEWLGKR